MTPSFIEHINWVDWMKFLGSDRDRSKVTICNVNLYVKKPVKPKYESSPYGSVSIVKRAMKRPKKV